MLTQIDLRHFKCFESLKLPLRPLTLLSGANASGKSSVLQALVLLHQTMREHEWSSRLMLNGGAVRLGTVADVIDQVHGHGTYEITLMDGGGARFQWEFEGERDEMSMKVQRARGETGNGEGWDIDESQALHYLLPTPLEDNSLTNRLCGLTYLTAERLGPREHYIFDDPQLTPVVGSRGEYAVSVLHSGRDTHILDKLVMDVPPTRFRQVEARMAVTQDVPPTRFRQVEARMARFFPDCVLAIEQVPRANAVTLGIRTSSGTGFQRPVHSGFGLTQVLPIIVAVLAANSDDLLLVENPEVHLHPAGQAAMGEFLAEAAAAGVQVMIETHSDHVLNGIRRAVRSGTLPSDDVALHFFSPRREDPTAGEPQVQSPILGADGNLDTWPEGFFDQFDKDMNDFAGWS